jgi:hypothetical protein
LELEIYNKEEIARARASPSFSREMEYKYAGLVGNVSSQLHIDKCVALGKEYDPNLINPMARNSLGIDPGFSSSNFAFCLTQMNIRNDTAEVLIAEEYERPDFNQTVKRAVQLIRNAGCNRP